MQVDLSDSAVLLPEKSTRKDVAELSVSRTLATALLATEEAAERAELKENIIATTKRNPVAKIARRLEEFPRTSSAAVKSRDQIQSARNVATPAWCSEYSAENRENKPREIAGIESRKPEVKEKFPEEESDFDCEDLWTSQARNFWYRE